MDSHEIEPGVIGTHTEYKVCRPLWDQVFSEILEVIAKRSLCLKMQTSALVVRGSQILSIGYNGTFSKHEECCDYWMDYYKDAGSIELYGTTGMSGKPAFEQWLNSEVFKKAHRDWSRDHEIHAEANALKWISKNDIRDCVMYTLHSPCDACAKDIIAHGIKTVKYKYKYKHGDKALVTLRNAGVQCEQLISEDKLSNKRVVISKTSQVYDCAPM